MRLNEEQVPKLYGLGTFERALVHRCNSAIEFFLSGIPAERQVDLIDQLCEDSLSFNLH